MGWDPEFSCSEFEFALRAIAIDIYTYYQIRIYTD